jgi:trk system potassium uptake protein TrkH
MLAGSLNFSLYFHAIRGKIYRLYEPELIIYFIIILLTCGFAAYNLYGTSITLLTGETLANLNVEEAIRYGSFQLISGQTTTGFATADYDLWPYTIQIIMVVLMFVGGMAGSTSGGMKVIRPYMLFRILQTRVESMFRPEAVRTFRIGNREVDTGVALTVLCFFLTTASIAVLGVFLYALTGVDPETGLGLVACMMNNIGLAFRAAGPSYSCAFLNDAGIAISSIWMILGRLEYFAVLVMFIPAFWKQNS